MINLEREDINLKNYIKKEVGEPGAGLTLSWDFSRSVIGNFSTETHVNYEEAVELLKAPFNFLSYTNWIRCIFGKDWGYDSIMLGVTDVSTNGLPLLVANNLAHMYTSLEMFFSEEYRFIAYALTFEATATMKDIELAVEALAKGHQAKCIGKQVPLRLLVAFEVPNSDKWGMSYISYDSEGSYTFTLNTWADVYADKWDKVLKEKMHSELEFGIYGEEDSCAVFDLRLKDLDGFFIQPSIANL